MLTIEEIRRDNLLLLIHEAGTLRALAELAGMNESYLSAVKTSARDLGSEAARQLEGATGRPRGWMDHLHTPQAGLLTALSRWLDTLRPEELTHVEDVLTITSRTLSNRFDPSGAAAPQQEPMIGSSPLGESGAARQRPSTKKRIRPKRK